MMTLLRPEQGLSRNYLDQPKWSAMREASYGHATLDFESITAATFRWHRNQVLT
jgi:acid phosphatase type 7